MRGGMWGHARRHVVCDRRFASATAAADRQFAEGSRPIAGACANLMAMQQVEQALSVLWTTQNAAERAQANDWLTAFQESARFKKGFKIEIRSSPLSNRWQLAMLAVFVLIFLAM